MGKIILTAFVLLLFPAFAVAQPAVHFAELNFDFGTVGLDDKAEHLFELTNTGDQDLVIEKVTAS